MTPGVLAPDPKEANPDDVPVLVDAGVAFAKLEASLDPSVTAGGAVDAESCVPCSAVVGPWLESSMSIPLAPLAAAARTAGIAAADVEDDGLPMLPLVLGAAEPCGLHRSTTSLPTARPVPPPIGILEVGAGVLDPPPAAADAAAVAEDAIQLDMVPCAVAVVAGLEAGAGAGAELYGLAEGRPAELAYGLAATPLPPPLEAYGLEKVDDEDDAVAAADGVGRTTPVLLFACC